MNAEQQVGRLALRNEGEFWVAYWAHPDTMEIATEIGRIRMSAVQDQEVKGFFMQLMQIVVGNIIESETGTSPKWGGPQQAPEREKGVKP